MAKMPSKLLTTLSAIGIATAVGAGDAKAVATYDSFGEFLSYTTASMKGDLQAMVDFVRAYPQSPAAQRMARTIARELATMAPAEQRAAMDQVAATGGLPAAVADVMSVANLSTSAVGPSNAARGLEVARGRATGVADTRIY